jgi:hypothetical protein
MTHVNFLMGEPFFFSFHLDNILLTFSRVIRGMLAEVESIWLDGMDALEAIPLALYSLKSSIG